MEFSGLALILVAAAAGGMVFRLLKQPMLLGYIGVGALLTATGYASRNDIRPLLELLGQLGVTFLLFLLGLELSLTELKRMGRVALATGFGQIIFTSIFGYLIALVLGFGHMPSLYLGIALTFSSTIIIVKLLSEKGDINSLYGKIAVGMLLVQDFVAIGILVVLSGLAGGEFNWTTLGIILAKGIAMIGVTLWLAEKVFPKFLARVGESPEQLFVAALAWCLGVAALVASPWVGFGLEIGGFLAGLALSNASSHFQIVARVRPLRDFFLTLFFVSLGVNINLANLSGIILPAAVFSLFILVGNPVIVMVIMGYMGYKKRTSFLTSVTVAQISEFSLVLVAMAYKVGQVGSEVLSLVTLVGVITMTASTYLILNSQKIYKRISGWLSVFERSKTAERRLDTDKLSGHVLLFGHNRTGSAVRPSLEKLGKPVVVVDFNPATVESLTREGVKAIYGDIADVELYEELAVEKADMVVSTVPDKTDNMQLLEYLSNLKTRPVVVMTAPDDREAADLYRAGAFYVLVPQRVGGELLAHMIRHKGIDKDYFRSAGDSHLHRLKNI